MNKKALIAAAAAVAVLASAIAAWNVFYSAEDRFSPLEKAKIRSMMSEPIYTETDENGAARRTPVFFAADGCMGFERNSIESFNEGAIGGAVEVNAAFTADGVPVLADSFDDALPDSVRLEEVFKAMTEKPNLQVCIRLNEVGSLVTFNGLVEKHYVNSRIYLTGIYSYNFDYFAENLKNCRLLLDYDKNDTVSFAEYAEKGAYGIVFESSELNEAAAALARENGLSVWVSCDDTLLGVCNALRAEADCIITADTQKVSGIYQTWSDDYAHDSLFDTDGE